MKEFLILLEFLKDHPKWIPIAFLALYFAFEEDIDHKVYIKFINRYRYAFFRFFGLKYYKWYVRFYKNQIEEIKAYDKAMIPFYDFMELFLGTCCGLFWVLILTIFFLDVCFHEWFMQTGSWWVVTLFPIFAIIVFFAVFSYYYLFQFFYFQKIFQCKKEFFFPNNNCCFYLYIRNHSFIVSINCFGLIPYSFTVTSHIIVTFFLSFFFFF